MFGIPRKDRKVFYEGSLEVLTNHDANSVIVEFVGNSFAPDADYEMSIDEAYELIDLLKEAIEDLGEKAS